MSALDQAFIKAYAKEPSPGSAAAPAGVSAESRTAAATAVAERARRSAVTHLASAQIENIYADGALYRIEIPAADQQAVPPPHYAARDSRGTRRMPLRYRQQYLASQEVESHHRDAAAPVPTSRRGQAQIHPRPIEVASEPLATLSVPSPELPQEDLVVNVPVVAPNPARAAAVVELKVIPPLPAPLSLWPLARSIEVREDWDTLLQNSQGTSDSALVVWPEHDDLAQAQSSSLIALNLETMPEVPSPSWKEGWDEAVPPVVGELIIEQVAEQVLPLGPIEEPEGDDPPRTFRLDAAHAAVPEPHEQVKVQDRPHAISEEEAAELIGIEMHVDLPLAEAAAPAAPPVTKISQPFVPAWEVDRFLWPALCDKLLQDERCYFAQAGSKIASAVRDGLKALAITGSRRGEGRTTLALCLARSAARSGLKVALVDADFSRPQIAASLGLEIAGSWHEAALGKIPLAEAAIKSVEENLTVFPLDVSTAVIPLSLAQPQLTRTLREAGGTFDLLVVDMGPLSAGSEPLFPSEEVPPADAAIVVRDLRYCTPAESQAIGERLQESGIEAVGIAENFVPQEKMAL